MKTKENNCAFQYFDGISIECDKFELTLKEAKDLYNYYYNDMVKKTKEGKDIEAAIWINMKNSTDYKDTLIHIASPNIDDNDNLWEKKFYNKL